jgi:hypothetical protein
MADKVARKKSRYPADFRSMAASSHIAGSGTRIPTAPVRLRAELGSQHAAPVQASVGLPAVSFGVLWSRVKVKTGLLVTAFLIVGVVGPISVTDAGAAAASSAVHRNTIACRYVYQTYSDLFQRPLKGFRPSDFSQKVAGAASATLRKQLTYWRVAKAYQNWAGVVETGNAMVNTCDHLGLSSSD